MAEEQFVQMYVRDFAHLAARAETGQDVDDQLLRRVGEARSHADLMDSRKEPGHLHAVADRLRATAGQAPVYPHRTAADYAAVAERREAFLNRVADLLESQATA
ncbi:MAG TPA: hypothetical protein VF559_09510 [Caulobacteraceae bacterium]|jgi:hypothetical protein